MKFLATFSAVLCALSLGVGAVPAAVPAAVEHSQLEARDDTTTANYNAAHAKNPSISTTKNSVFKITWAQNPSEKDPKMKALTSKLGFSHIGIMVGKVVETKTGPPKKQATKKDFVGQIYDMQGTTATTQVVKNWDSTRGGTLQYVKDTSKSSSQVKAAGQAYVDEHKTYDYENNNCNTYATHLIAAL